MWIAHVAKTAAISFEACAATLKKAGRSSPCGMARGRKRGSPDTQTSEDKECVICFERFVTRRRTVNNGTPQRVRIKPFVCIHDLCEVCDDTLKQRGSGRCPVCRSERLTPIANDTRNDRDSENDPAPPWTEWNSSTSAYHAFMSSLAHRRFLQMDLERQRRSFDEAEQADQTDESGNAGAAGASGEATDSTRPTQRQHTGAGNGNFTQIRQEDQDLIAHLLDPVNTSLTQFSSMLRSPPTTTAVRIVRFRPYNP